MKNFYNVLVNTLLANVTTSYLWFALTFWLYLETRSVLVTGFVGGAYMLLIALFSIWFGTLVDRYKKKNVMLGSSIFSLAMFLIGGAVFAVIPEAELLRIDGVFIWLFASIILIGAVVENMRNVALSTTVTLLVEKDKRANANGLVGATQGVSFIICSVLSGLSVGMLGMGWTLVIAILFTAAALVHLFFVSIPEEHVLHDPELANKKIDIRGSLAAIHAIPGLFALIIFSTFNNFIGGVYMALMDPYGLTIFTVEQWGAVFGVAGTGFVVGGIIVAKYGLGKNPMKTLLRLAIIMGLLGSFFTIREWWWLYAAGIWLYMTLIPAIEAAEQTIIQQLVPFKRQGRVFGFAQAFEAAAAPITAFLIAPIAEFFIIPYMNSESGKASFQWLLGDGETRGIALVFFVAGLVLVAAALIAFKSKPYRKLSELYAAKV